MNHLNYCFAINSYHQAIEVISIFKKDKKIPVLLIKNYIIKGFGIDWIIQLKHMLSNQYKSKDFEILIEVNKDYGLCINLIEQKINYINVKADLQTIKRLSQIAKLNKVVINPSFSIVDLTKSKKLNLKLKKYII